MWPAPFYDAYLELDRATFFLTQTVVRGMVEQGRVGAIVNIGSMWPTRPSRLPRRRPTPWPRPGGTR
jgi:NAD(P)-dependent dehydrogenase (short-subunit alcohol dehydrogenase family)